MRFIFAHIQDITWPIGPNLAVIMPLYLRNALKVAGIRPAGSINFAVGIIYAFAINQTMKKVLSKTNLWEQSCGAILWGFFFILAPFGVLIFGVIIWLPLLIWRERVRTRQHGFWTGALCRFAVMLAIIFFASQAPCKKENWHVGKLQDRNVTLADLTAAKVIYPLRASNDYSLKITLPSTNPTYRETMQAISEQTGLSANRYRCACDSSILFGSGGGLIRVSKSL